jgi:hypothetical protein
MPYPPAAGPAPHADPRMTVAAQKIHRAVRESEATQPPPEKESKSLFGKLGRLFVEPDPPDPKDQKDKDEKTPEP